MENLIDEKEAYFLALEAIELGKEISFDSENFKELIVDAKLIKAAAKELMIFYDRVKLIQDHKKKLSKSLATLDNAETNNLKNFIETVREAQDTSLYKEIMARIFNLQKLINNFLHQEIKMVYVYVDEDAREIKLYEFEEDINNITNGGKISTNVINNENLKDYSYFNENDKHLPSLNETFFEIARRRKIYFDVYNRQAKEAITRQLHKKNNELSRERMESKLNKTSFYILWREQMRWVGKTISGFGIIKEAYFNFFMHNISFTKDMETNVKDYILNEKYGAFAVDSTPGFFEEDVDAGNGLYYGVKGSGASAMGYDKIIKSLDLIVDSLDENMELTLKNLKESFEKNDQGYAVTKLKDQFIKDTNEKILSPSDVKREYNKIFGL